MLDPGFFGPIGVAITTAIAWWTLTFGCACQRLAGEIGPPDQSANSMALPSDR